MNKGLNVFIFIIFILGICSIIYSSYRLIMFCKQKFKNNNKYSNTQLENLGNEETII